VGRGESEAGARKTRVIRRAEGCGCHEFRRAQKSDEGAAKSIEN